MSPPPVLVHVENVKIVLRLMYLSLATPFVADDGNTGSVCCCCVIAGSMAHLEEVGQLGQAGLPPVDPHPGFRGAAGGGDGGPALQLYGEHKCILRSG